MSADDNHDFWDRLESINAGLLGTKDGAANIVPMSHQLRDGDSTIWFITARDTDLAQATATGSAAATYMIAEGGKGLYAVIEGDLAQNNDPALRDELWSTVADSWFDGGKDDPDVRIIGLTPRTANVWVTTTSGVAFAFQIARAEITGHEPDVGRHFTLSGPDFAR